MRRLLKRHVVNAATLAAAAGLAACTLDRVEPPLPGGPSELTPAVTLRANPDSLNWDGQDQSQIEVVARRATGEPYAGLVLRAEIRVDNQPQDFGSLNPRQVVTDSAGRAILTYKAPPAPGLVAPDTVTPRIVSIVVLPVGVDFSSAVPRSVKIQVVPLPGPQDDNPLAFFIFSPLQPGAGETIFFDARGSQAAPGRSIVSYHWDFGKGTTGTGQMVQKAYNTPATYAVTLTVTDNTGAQGSFVRHVPVGQ